MDAHVRAHVNYKRLFEHKRFSYIKLIRNSDLHMHMITTPICDVTIKRDIPIRHPLVVFVTHIILAKKMADSVRLCELPDDFGECFLPYRATLRQRVQAKKYSNESYVTYVKLFRGDGSIHMKAGVFRSQRKGEDPHRVTLEIGEQTILEAHCTCQAG